MRAAAVYARLRVPPRRRGAQVEVPTVTSARTVGIVRWTSQAGLQRLLLLGLSVCAYAVSAAHPPLASETRYLLAAREMVSGHDWVVPHLCFVPYLEKPILTYWLAAICHLWFGPSPFAARLVSGLAVLGMVLITYEFGRHLRGPRFGLVAALLLFASAQILTMSSFLITDPLFSFFMTLGWYSFWRHHQERRGGWRHLCWLSLALAWLTKGPLALVLAACGVGGYLGVRQRRRFWSEMRALRPIQGLAILTLVLAPWHVAVWLRDPRFLEMFYWRLNVGAFRGERVHHTEPFWFYGPVLLLSLLPWTLPAVVALGVQLRDTLRALVNGTYEEQSAAEANAPEGTRALDARLYLSCTVVLPLIFLSVSRAKLATYVMPLLPCLVLLLGEALMLQGCRVLRGWRWSALVQFAIVTLLVMAAPFVPPLRERGAQLLEQGRLSLVIGPAIVVLASQGWFAVALLRGRVLSGVGVAGAGFVVACSWVVPNLQRIDPLMNSRALAEFASIHGDPDDEIVLSDRCVQDYSIVWALNRRPRILGRPRELGMGHFTEVTSPDRPLPELPDWLTAETLPENPYLWSVERLRSQWLEDRRLWIFTGGEWEARLRKAGLPLIEVGRNRKHELFTNRPLGTRSGAHSETNPR